MTAKQEHLRDGPQPARAAPSSDAAPAAPPVDEVLEITIDNPHGLHARPAAKLVGLARSLDARITVANLETGQGPVDAASLSLVATLNVRQGSRVRVTASGGKAHSAVRAIQELAARRFDDAPTPGPSRAAAAPTGSGLDIALGPAVVPDLEVDTSGYVPAGVEDERQRSRAAATSVSHELEASSSHTAEQAGSPEASVFEAHIALLSDPEVVDAVETDIASGQSAVQAWATRLDALADRFAQLDDTYQRARAQDVRAVRRQVLRALTGQRAPVPPGEGVLVVPEIDAATAAGLDAEATLGIVTVSGGNSGHGVIIAKSRGIPIITGVGDAADGVEAGTTVAFDASAGTFWADPGPEQVRRIRATVADRRRGRTAALADAESPAVTTDGCRVAVLANVGSVADAATAASN
ncbi:MAG: HPr family phosphocarrier protein, partial [Nocardioidaceae bacterium]